MHPAEYLDMQAVKEEEIRLRGKTVTRSKDTKIVSNLLQVTYVFILFLIGPTSVKQELAPHSGQLRVTPIHNYLITHLLQ